MQQGGAFHPIDAHADERCGVLQGGTVAAVVAERAVRTPKYLYAVVTGCAVVTPAHLQVGAAGPPRIAGFAGLSPGTCSGLQS